MRKYGPRSDEAIRWCLNLVIVNFKQNAVVRPALAHSLDSRFKLVKTLLDPPLLAAVVQPI
jgi:cytochrome c oxidase subunit IV